MNKSVREVIGDPASWPDFQLGGTRMPLLRGATIVGSREVEPDELRLAIDARGQVLRSTFIIADRDVRQRLLVVRVHVWCRDVRPVLAGAQEATQPGERRGRDRRTLNRGVTFGEVVAAYLGLPTYLETLPTRPAGEGGK